MLSTIPFNSAVYPLAMLLLGIGSLVLNIYLAKRYNERFKRDEMSKKADKIYVDKEIKKIEKETDLKIQIIREGQEETRSTLDYIRDRIDKIYDKHYEP